jgi:hypothetical protein
MTAGRPALHPFVSEASLYSCLVTRHTGRAVRTSIERQVARCAGEVLTVLDFRNVAVIDFSCADEIVAKLAWVAVEQRREGGAKPIGPRRSFVLVRGLEEHHWDPIDSALRRRDLAVAAERSDGEPVLLGSVDEPEARLWHLVCEYERVTPAPLAGELGLPEREARSRLDGLHRRRLVLRQAGQYVSFRRLMVENSRRAGGRLESTPG